MDGDAQRRALQNYRSRLSERGMGRFEVLGLEGDRELIRSLARRLAENGPEAEQIREAVRRALNGDGRKKGGILRALLNSPLRGSGIDLTRERVEERKVDL